MKTLYSFAPMLLTCSCLFLFSLYIYFLTKPRIYRYPAKGWIDIKSNPIPDDATDILITDGKDVRHVYTVEWGSNGKVIMSCYNKTFVTHWQPMPEAPK